MASSTHKSILHMKPASALHFALAAAGGIYPEKKKSHVPYRNFLEVITAVNFEG